MHTLRSQIIALLATATVCACGGNTDITPAPDGGSVDGTTPQFSILTINSQGEGQGSILVNGEGCDNYPCSFEFAIGATLTIEATPALDSNFAGWSSHCNDTRSCELVIEEDLALAANFNIAGKLLGQTKLADFGETTTVVGPNGSFYVVGSYRNSPPEGFERPDPFRYVGYYAKFAPEGGDPIWIRNFSLGSNISTDYVAAAVSAEGDLYLAAEARFRSKLAVQRINPETGAVIWTIEGTVRIDGLQTDGMGGLFAVGRVGTETIYSFGNFNFPAQTAQRHFAAKISSTGAVSSPVLMPSAPVNVRGVLPLPEGGIYVSRGTRSGAQHFLERFTAGGALESSVTALNSGTLALAPNSDLIVAGLYRQSLNWGDSPELKAPKPRVRGLFVGRWREDGTAVWLRAADVSNESERFFLSMPGKGLIVGDQGNIYLSGVLADAGTFSLGGEPLPRFGEVDAFLASLSQDGDHRWSKSFGANAPGFHHTTFNTLFLGSDTTLQAVLAHTVPIMTERGELPGGLSLLEFER